MAQAAVQSSCERLRSATVDRATMRLSFTSNLQQILEQLEAIDAVIPNAEEVENVDSDYVQEWQSEVEDADHDDVQKWQSEVEDADHDDGQKWQSKVKNAANSVCHMLDKLQEMAVLPARKKMTRMLGRRENIVIDPESNEVMLKEMKEITEKLKKLHHESVQFDDVADIRALLQAPELAVERVADLRRILARLSAGLPFGEKGPIVLVITGYGYLVEESIGRATMAALVFNHNKFKCYSRIWINQSRMLKWQEIGKHIISQLVPAGEEEMTGAHVLDDEMGYITNRLQELLHGKKVLIVLHSITRDPFDLTGLKDMLSGGGAYHTELIVIATAFDGHMASDFGVRPYYLRPLSEDMCCTIIKQVAIRSQDRTSADREDLERIAPQAARLCAGVPLAAQLYGVVLQFKQYTKWIEQEDFSDNPVAAPMQLILTYLSPDLRLCFDYCALQFLRAREIAKEELIHEWIALGLIECPQLAEQYLKRLLDMSLLQTAISSRMCALAFMEGQLKGDPKYYCDFSYCTEQFSYASCANADTEDMKYILREFHHNIRALSCLGCSKMKLRGNLFSSVRCLRVLELHESSIRKLPESICQLMNLGYLILSGWSGLVTLPESIGDLTNLLHINLSSCSGLVNLPGSFGKLINLVHISLSGCSKLESLPESFRKLIKLAYIDLSGSALILLPEFSGKMVNLVHINLSGCLALANLPISLGKLTKLKHINLSGCPKLVNLPGSFGMLTNLSHISLSGCNALETLPGTFGKLTNLVHINLSGCNALETLPGTFGKLTNLVHINLSGCTGLVNLPASFRELRSLVHANLSGCNGLEELPQSFGKLISLVHINLSGCSGLATLPGSFGALKNLLHINLSHCYGLSKLPGSFGKLKKLVHLDLSFWSCFEEIALDGLTKLEHLNLSHPCSYRADYHHLKKLKEVLSQFVRLKHLNLSMFLNPIFCNQSESENLECIKFISGFSRLEYLDLSPNIFLGDLPQSLSGLHRLHTLDLSGCIKFKKQGRWMDRMKSLRSVVLSDLESYQFVVGAHSVMNNYGQLVDVRCKELEITRLEEMKKSAEEPCRIRLEDKQNLEKLKLCWTLSSEGSVEDNGLLGELVPPHSLQCLELHGYNSTCLPSWLTSSIISSFSIVEVSMEDIPNCNHLPPLGLLQNLQRVVLRSMGSITRIDAGDLSGGSRAAFPRLSSFTIDDMPSLEEFITTYCIGEEEHHLFTVNDVLEVRKCPKMSFVPVPARARKLVISECSDVMVCCQCQNRAGRHGVEGPSCIPSPVTTQVTELVVENCNVCLSHWCLLNHLPGLRSLTINNCRNLISSPEIIEALSSLETLCLSECMRDWALPQHLGHLRSLRILEIKSCIFRKFPDSMRFLTSLESMHFSDCEYMEEIPERLGSLSSLHEIIIERCQNIDYLPPSIGEFTNLKELHILHSISLEKWCRTYANKKTLGHVVPKFKEIVPSQRRQQFEEMVEDDSEQSGLDLESD